MSNDDDSGAGNSAPPKDLSHLAVLSYVLLWSSVSSALALPYWVMSQLLLCQQGLDYESSLCKPNGFVHWLVVLDFAIAAVAVWCLITDLLAAPEAGRESLQISPALRKRYRIAFYWTGAAVLEASVLLLAAL